jgi:hypothetical protein
MDCCHARDGSLSIFLQHKSPGKDKETNWLPTPDGPFYMVIRLYGPRAQLLSANWTPPELDLQYNEAIRPAKVKGKKQAFKRPSEHVSYKIYCSSQFHH